MKIAIVTTSYPAFAGDPSGHFVATEAEAHAASGEQVTVLAPGRAATSISPKPNPRVVRVSDAQVFGWPGALARLRERPLRLGGALEFVWAARQALRRLGPFERVIAHFIVPCAWPIAVHGRAPLEVVCHGSDVRLLLALPRKLRTRVVHKLIEHGTSFRFVSAELREQLAQGSGFPELRLARVLPSPIEVGAVPERLAARAELGILAKERLIVVIGRLLPDKRVAVALSAALLVPNARVVVIGDGPERARLERRFAGASFQGTLPRPAALTWLAAADVLVSASRLEGAPTVVREARLLGVPVVATRAGDLATWAAADAGISLVDPRP